MGHQGCCTEGKRMNMSQASTSRQAPGESLLTSLTSQRQIMELLRASVSTSGSWAECLYILPKVVRSSLPSSHHGVWYLTRAQNVLAVRCHRLPLRSGHHVLAPCPHAQWEALPPVHPSGRSQRVPWPLPSCI